jgi:hypothetical protein
MIKKVICAYIVSCTISLTALSDDSIDVEGRVAPITQGEEAPFTGTLFDQAATSSLIVRLESIDQKCKIKTDQKVEELNALHNLEKGNLNLKLDTCTILKKDLLEIKSNQILFLQDEIKRYTKPRSEIWFASGVVAGIILTVASAYSINQVSK